MKVFKLGVWALLFLFASCQKDTNAIDGNIPVSGENFNFYKSADLYSNAQSLRSENFSDEFEISGVELVGKDLNVIVSYNGSCETSKFDVIWDGYVMETFPQRINLIIKRTATNCNPNGATKNEVLSIDLVEFMGLSEMPENTVFTVSNASKIPEEDNADIITSTNSSNTNN